MRAFQLHLSLATPKPSSRKRTYSYRILSMKTLRFLLINRVARLARISGRKVLRFSPTPLLNPSTSVSSTASPPDLFSD
jgi:hypothetical protein